jgi:hypothetical protein
MVCSEFCLLKLDFITLAKPVEFCTDDIPYPRPLLWGDKLMLGDYRTDWGMVRMG